MLLVIFLIVTIYLLISLRLRVKRQELYNRIDLLYTEIELALIKSGIQITPNVQMFLATRKAFYVNREVIDFEFLIKNYRGIPAKEIEKISKLFQYVKSTLPSEMARLTDEFDKTIGKMVILNSISTSFAVFMLIEILPLFVKVFLNTGIGRIKTVFKQLRENEPEIAAKTFHLA